MDNTLGYVIPYHTTVRSALTLRVYHMPAHAVNAVTVMVLAIDMIRAWSLSPMFVGVTDMRNGLMSQCRRRTSSGLVTTLLLIGLDEKKYVGIININARHIDG